MRFGEPTRARDVLRYVRNVLVVGLPPFALVQQVARALDDAAVRGRIARQPWRKAEIVARACGRTLGAPGYGHVEQAIVAVEEGVEIEDPLSE